MVLDPNVLISAAITPSGATAEVIRLIDSGMLVPIVSPLLLSELARVLGRPRFRRYIGINVATAFILELERLAEVAPDVTEAPAVSRDRADDYLIALARTASADALVSGDPDLLTLRLADLPILSPRELLEAFAR